VQVIQDLDEKKPTIMFTDTILKFLNNTPEGWYVTKWSHQEEWPKDVLKQ
jgi:hypothetical protein